MSVPAEVLKKVKLLEFSTRKLVNNIFSGEYHSAFRGQGMTFSEFREYIPGDDIRAISWPLTARTGKPFIKVFEEERELSLILAVDVSGSGDYGSGQYFKGEMITHIAALMGFSAVKNGDPIGLLLFSDRIEHYVPPKKGRAHLQRILRDLYYYKPISRKTKIKTGLDYLRGVLKKRSTIFLLSDFQDENFDQSLRMLGKKHEVIAIAVEDPTESKIPDLGLLEVVDPETGEQILIDTSDKHFRETVYKESQQQKAERQKMLQRSQVDLIQINDTEDFVDPLIKYFQRRNRG